MKLDALHIPLPCTVPWETMKGTDTVRHCGECNKHVYNLSALSREEAEQLLLETQGKICVNMFVRPDGTVMTNECAPGAQKRRVRLRMFGRIAAGASALLACGSPEETTAPTVPSASTAQVRPTMLRGEVAEVPTQAPSVVPTASASVPSAQATHTPRTPHSKGKPVKAQGAGVPEPPFRLGGAPMIVKPDP